MFLYKLILDTYKANKLHHYLLPPKNFSAKSLWILLRRMNILQIIYEALQDYSSPKSNDFSDQFQLPVTGTILLDGRKNAPGNSKSQKCRKISSTHLSRISFHSRKQECYALGPYIRLRRDNGRNSTVSFDCKIYQ